MKRKRRHRTYYNPGFMEREKKRDRFVRVALVASIAAAIQTHEKIIVGPHGMNPKWTAARRRERIKERVEIAIAVLKEAERQVK